MRRIVLLGTGTSVGKTYVAVALARALARLQPDVPVLPFKPLETGIEPLPGGAPPPGSDAARLEDAIHLCNPPRPHPIETFPDPVSPFRAAANANRNLRVRDLATATLSALRDATLPYTRAWALIETAGGAFSPITAAETNADLAAALDPALWVLVAPDALGVVHDATATLTALRASYRAPDLLVLTASRAPDASTGGNRDELRAVGAGTPMASLPRDSSDAVDLARALLDVARVAR